MRSAIGIVALGLALILFVGGQAAAREHCDLERLQEEIRWCLVEAPEDVPGRERMAAALERQGSETDLFQFRIGFADCHGRDLDTVRNFLQCRRDNPMALFNFGRALLDLPPAGGDS